MHDDLRERIRLAAGRTAQPTAAIIDSQSVEGSEMVVRSSRGYDAGKKINGTKRHLAVDTIGLLLTVLVTTASVQDRNAARPLLWNLRRAFPTVKLAWADGGYAGKECGFVAGDREAEQLFARTVAVPDPGDLLERIPQPNVVAWVHHGPAWPARTGRSG